MEAAERIVEAYVRYVRHRWGTVSNIKCEGQYEIDLLATDCSTAKHYHIEIDGSIDPAWRTLTGECLRDYLGRKFSPAQVVQKVAEYFPDGEYSRIVVWWDWNESAEQVAQELGVELWRLPCILREIRDFVRVPTIALPDDTLRTIQLYQRALDDEAED